MQGSRPVAKDLQQYSLRVVYRPLEAPIRIAVQQCSSISPRAVGSQRLIAIYTHESSPLRLRARSVRQPDGVERNGRGWKGNVLFPGCLLVAVVTLLARPTEQKRGELAANISSIFESSVGPFASCSPGAGDLNELKNCRERVNHTTRLYTLLGYCWLGAS